MPTAGLATVAWTATGRERNDTTRQDGNDQQGGRGSRKKSDLLPERSLIATATSAAIGCNKQGTEETRGRRTIAVGRGGGGGGGGDGEDMKRRGKRGGTRCLT